LWPSLPTRSQPPFPPPKEGLSFPLFFPPFFLWTKFILLKSLTRHEIVFFTQGDCRLFPFSLSTSLLSFVIERIFLFPFFVASSLPAIGVSPPTMAYSLSQHQQKSVSSPLFRRRRCRRQRHFSPGSSISPLQEQKDSS